VTHRDVVTTRRADEDIDNAVAHYVATETDTALRFVDALEDAKDLLTDRPYVGSPRFAVETGIPELRGLVLRKFPYVLLYTEDPDAIRIHRVLHTSRDIATELDDRD
jgi:toxin ParE1/3/4